MQTCPSREHLQRMLADLLTPVEEFRFNDHLLQCNQCQLALEEMTQLTEFGVVDPPVENPSATEAAFLTIVAALARIYPKGPILTSHLMTPSRETIP